MKIVTANQMREIDRITIEERGVPGIELMERAGQKICNHLFYTDNIIIVTGKGNNAGDGFVVARLLHERGNTVKCILLSPSSSLSGDAKTNYERLPNEVKQVEINDTGNLTSEFENADWIVDAILGTGTKGAVHGIYAEAIEIINQSKAYVLSIDIPSGLPTNGAAPEIPAIKANKTVAIGLPKIGSVIYPGIEYCGRLEIENIGFEEDLLNSPEIKCDLITHEKIKAILPKRKVNGHKGTFGRVLIVAGSDGMTGAALLTAQGALRSGVGLVYCAIPKNQNLIFETNLLEALSIPLEEKEQGYLTTESVDKILDQASKMNAVAIGPGLGQNPETQKLICELVQKIEAPIVLDADGLNAIAGNLEIIKNRNLPIILAPHPGEFSRLNNLSITEIENNRVDVARKFAEDNQCYLILKGARSILATPDGNIFINPFATSGLAKGGSGDLLTGLISGLLAQGIEPASAANIAMYIHGLAATKTAEKLGERSMLTSDIISQLGAAFLEIEGHDWQDDLPF